MPTMSPGSVQAHVAMHHLLIRSAVQFGPDHRHIQRHGGPHHHGGVSIGLRDGVGRAAAQPRQERISRRIAHAAFTSEFGNTCIPPASEGFEAAWLFRESRAMASLEKLEPELTGLLSEVFDTA